MTPLAVYIHIPFCTVKCGYCDFNTYAGLDPLKPAYAGALLREVESWAPLLAVSRVTSISFGGGTPGEFPADAIGATIEAIGSRSTFEPGAEVSIEANPGTTMSTYLRDLQRAGVNRVSFGAQSFDPDELRFLDRIHSPEAIGASLQAAREAGIAGVGLDLIYGLPSQPAAAWERSLESAIALGPDHLSCYSLTVEEGTPLAARVANGQTIEPDADVAASMYELTEDTLAAAGFSHYEISNWARPGHESRHNLAYWTDRPYLGLGAGAHGYLRTGPAGSGEGMARMRYENIAHPRGYIAAAGRPPAAGRGLPPTVAANYTPAGAMELSDWLETALRLTAGFELRA
ncbi:MAG: radical SAM family heme chaperone HemW, partial [Dehalococcoidia bacterium]